MTQQNQVVTDRYDLWVFYQGKLLNIRRLIRQHWNTLNERGQILLLLAEKVTMDELDRLEGTVT